MQRMVTFRLNRECRDIAVNPALVLYVCHYQHGASSVHFSKDCFVRVEGDLEEVVRRLESDSAVSQVPHRPCENEPQARSTEVN